MFEPTTPPPLGAPSVSFDDTGVVWSAPKTVRWEALGPSTPELQDGPRVWKTFGVFVRGSATTP